MLLHPREYYTSSTRDNEEGGFAASTAAPVYKLGNLLRMPGSPLDGSSEQQRSTATKFEQVTEDLLGLSLKEA